MQLLDLHNNNMKNITIYINNYEYQIKVLKALLKLINVETDNPLILAVISRININAHNYLTELVSYIDEIKKTVSFTYLSDIKSLSEEELKKLLISEKILIEGIIDNQQVLNDWIIDLIKNKYKIADILNNEALGL